MNLDSRRGRGLSASFDEHGVQGLCVEHAFRPCLHERRFGVRQFGLDPGRRGAEAPGQQLRQQACLAFLDPFFDPFRLSLIHI